MPTLTKVVKQLQSCSLADGTFSIGSNGATVWKPNAGVDVFRGVVDWIEVTGMPSQVSFRLRVDGHSFASFSSAIWEVQGISNAMPQETLRSMRSQPESKAIADQEGEEIPPVSLSAAQVELESNALLDTATIGWLLESKIRIFAHRRNVWILKDGVGNTIC